MATFPMTLIKRVLVVFLLSVSATTHAAVLLGLDVYVDDVTIVGGDGSVQAGDLGLLGQRFDFILDLGRVDEFTQLGGVPVDRADVTSPLMNFFGAGTLAANGSAAPVTSIPLDATGTAGGTFMVGGENYNIADPVGGSVLQIFFIVPIPQAVTSPVEVVDFLMKVTHWNGSLSVALTGPGGYASNLELSLTSTPIPLPAGFVLLLSALGGLAGYRQRRAR